MQKTLPFVCSVFTKWRVYNVTKKMFNDAIFGEMIRLSLGNVKLLCHTYLQERSWPRWEQYRRSRCGKHTQCGYTVQYEIVIVNCNPKLEAICQERCRRFCQYDKDVISDLVWGFHDLSGNQATLPIINFHFIPVKVTIFFSIVFLIVFDVTGLGRSHMWCSAWFGTICTI